MCMPYICYILIYRKIPQHDTEGDLKIYFIDYLKKHFGVLNFTYMQYFSA